MNKILSVIVAMVMTLAMVTFASPASADPWPYLNGVVKCNHKTGKFDVVWTLTGDSADYPNTQGTVISQNTHGSKRVKPTFVGRTVTGDIEIQTATQRNVKRGYHQLTVGVQFDDFDYVIENFDGVRVSGPCAKR